MVTRIDRLARSIGDLQDIVRADPRPVARMLGVFAEFETNLCREAPARGHRPRPKAAGVYRGRKPSIDQAQVEKLRAEGPGAPTEIAKAAETLAVPSVYRVLAS